jgi:polyphosphate kinase 2 (PPK2 family)
MTADNSNSKKMKRKEYEKHLHKLQFELCRLQDWVKAEGMKVIVLFEGRDAAGKGGTIKAITERVSPRVFRVVALPAPSDREKSQMYIQRSRRPRKNGCGPSGFFLPGRPRPLLPALMPSCRDCASSGM